MKEIRTPAERSGGENAWEPETCGVGNVPVLRHVRYVGLSNFESRAPGPTSAKMFSLSFHSSRTGRHSAAAK